MVVKNIQKIKTKLHQPSKTHQLFFIFVIHFQVGAQVGTNDVCIKLKYQFFQVTQNKA